MYIFFRTTSEFLELPVIAQIQIQCFCSVLIKPFALVHYYYYYCFLLLQFSNCFLLQRFPRIFKIRIILIGNPNGYRYQADSLMRARLVFLNSLVFYFEVIHTVLLQ